MEEKRHINWKQILLIVAMSTMLLSLVALTALSFAPMSLDNFFTASDYTIINFALSTFEEYKEYGNTIMPKFISAIMGLALLGATVLSGLIFLSLNAIKFIKTLKNNEYVDFSKGTSIVYSLFIATFVFMSGFIFDMSGQSGCYHNGWIIFAIAIIGLFILFNIFVREYLTQNKDILSIIPHLCTCLLVLVLVPVVGFNLGAQKYYLIAKVLSEDYSSAANGTPNNLGVISFVLDNIEVIDADVVSKLTSGLITSGISVFLELVVFGLVIFVSAHLLNKRFDKPLKIKSMIIYSSISIVCLVGTLILNSITAKTLSGVDSVSFYCARIDLETINNNIIINLVVAVLLLGAIIGYFVYKRKTNKVEQ